MNTSRAYASPDAHGIYGTAYDDALGDQVRVTVVATGLSRHQSQQRRTAPPLQVLRTGTDNVPFNVPTINNAVAGPGRAHRTPPCGGQVSIWCGSDETSRTRGG